MQNALPFLRRRVGTLDGEVTGNLVDLATWLGRYAKIDLGLVNLLFFRRKSSARPPLLCFILAADWAIFIQVHRVLLKLTDGAYH